MELTRVRSACFEHDDGLQTGPGDVDQVRGDREIDHSAGSRQLYRIIAYAVAEMQLFNR